jgi:predicted AAA+ superfamily ATPase
VNVSVDTVRRWLTTLTHLHHGFVVRPWFRNVKKSLRKEPRYYLRDWSGIDDPGARAETYVACHLFKAVQTWQDLGLGEFALHYLRDKMKREVDFVVIRDGQPWFLVEVKQSETRLSPQLEYFQRQLHASHAFQVVLDLPYVQKDPFTLREPVVVPAATLLSQLP